MFKTIVGVMEISACIALTSFFSGQAQGQVPKVQVPSQIVGFAEFKASLPKTERGAYIVEGDLPVYSEVDLKQYYDDYVNPSAKPSQSIVNTRRDQDYGVGTWVTVNNIWSDKYKHALTYCINNDFKEKEKADLVKALASASRAWMLAADVRFIYKPEEDSTCSEANNNVLFNVAIQPNKNGLGAAFFPMSDTDIAAKRNVRTLYFSPKAFTTQGYTLLRIVTHELGHILGFMHEWIDQNMTGDCSNGMISRNRITPYDPSSIMTYLYCNGGAKADEVSDYDKKGASALYGPPVYIYAGLAYTFQNGWNNWSGGYLDTKNRGCQDNMLCVSTAQSANRDNGSGHWKIWGTQDTSYYRKIESGDSIALMNQYAGNGGWLATKGSSCEGNFFCVSTANFDYFSNSSSEVWVISSASGQPGPLLNSDEVTLHSLYKGNGGYLDTRDRGCQDNLLCVSTAQSANRDNGSGTWRITRSPSR